MVLIKVIGCAEYAEFKRKLFSFCEKTGLRYKAVAEIRKLRQQLTNEINLNISDLNLSIDPKYVSYIIEFFYSGVFVCFELFFILDQLFSDKISLFLLCYYLYLLYAYQGWEVTRYL